MNKASNNNKLAVSMRWDGQGAPTVTAKGKGLVAEEIIALGTQHGVPLRSDTELVALLSTVALNEEIPEQLYMAVAEVIAFAYSLKQELDLKPLPK